MMKSINDRICTELSGWKNKPLLALILILMIFIPMFGFTNSISDNAAGQTELAFRSSIIISDCDRQTRSLDSTYNATDIFSVHGGSLAGGMVSVNLDEDTLQEILVVGGSHEGETNLIDYNTENDTFDSTILWWDENGGLIDIAVGEIDPTHDGLEILVGGYSGNLTVLYYTGVDSAINKTIWNTSPVKEDSKDLQDIFSIAIGDFDPRTTGNEIAVADATTYFLYLLSNNDNKWVETKVPLGDQPRSLEVNEFDSSNSGKEILAMCVNGSVFKVSFDTTTEDWSVVEIFKDDNTPFNAIFSDFNSTNSGNEIIITGLSWNTTLVWGSGETWYNKTIWHAPGALEGIAYGDFDQLNDGKEICLTGYLNTAVMLYPTDAGTKWANELIFKDQDALQTELNGVVVTDFYDKNPGNELIIIGFNGKVRMLVFQSPDFELSVSSATKTVQAGNFESFRFQLEIISGYDADIKLSFFGAPPESTFSFSRTVLTPISGTNSEQDTTSSVLTIETTSETPAGVYNLTVVGTNLDDDRNKSVGFTLTVTPFDKPEPDFYLDISPLSQTLNLSKKQYYAEIRVEIISINEFDNPVDIYINTSSLETSGLNDVLTINILPGKIGPGDYATINISISEEFKETRIITIPIHGIDPALDIKSSQDLELELIYYKKPVLNDNNEDDITSQQYAAMGLMLAAIIILSVFMAKRMRDMSRSEQRRRDEREQARAQARARASQKGPRGGRPPYPRSRQPGRGGRRGGM
jgi:hypothetical protein